MPVENRAGFVRNGLRHVVAFDEHRVERRNRPFVVVARTFHELRKLRKDGRRITATRRGLARRETDFALRAGKTRNGVHHE